jgi:hypothetical protein
MFYYENAKGEKFKIAFHCRGHVETLIKPGTADEWMGSEELSKVVFGDDVLPDPNAEDGEEWDEVGELAAHRLETAYLAQKRAHTENFKSTYLGVDVVKRPFDFEGELTIIFRYADSDDLGVAFLNEDGEWQDCPMSKHILENVKI